VHLQLIFAETDLGYVGTQNKFLLKILRTNNNWCQERTNLLIQGTKAEDITASGMILYWPLAIWNLKLLSQKEIVNGVQTIAGVDTDNHFKQLGVYDSKFERIIITKLDYIPLNRY
jgi:hypothetical protein